LVHVWYSCLLIFVTSHLCGSSFFSSFILSHFLVFSSSHLCVFSCTHNKSDYYLGCVLFAWMKSYWSGSNGNRGSDSDWKAIAIRSDSYKIRIHCLMISDQWQKHIVVWKSIHEKMKEYGSIQWYRKNRIIHHLIHIIILTINHKPVNDQMMQLYF